MSIASKLTGAAMQITLRCCLAGVRAASWRHGGRTCANDIVAEAILNQLAAVSGLHRREAYLDAVDQS